MLFVCISQRINGEHLPTGHLGGLLTIWVGSFEKTLVPTPFFFDLESLSVYGSEESFVIWLQSLLAMGIACVFSNLP